MTLHILLHEMNTPYQLCPVVATRIKWSTADV
jgi:hypothetical protein